MSKQCLSVFNTDGVLLSGYYKKLKTMKKKFFVLYNETATEAARIEYYDNEKKFKSGFTPKRIIKLKNCFSINRRLYTKHDFVIVLSSKEGGFGIVMDSEDEMNTWLNYLLILQRSKDTPFDFPQFDNVWQVVIQKKGIAEQHSLFGSYHICLTNKSITFIKIGREKISNDKKITRTEILLTTIRRCGDSQCYFYMEIGRQCTLGPGELWMETEDSLTAQNMHSMILSKMITLNESLEPMRKRSSSATESSNPLHERKSTNYIDISNNCPQNAQNYSRDRCDSLPSRNRTSSECNNHNVRITSTSTVQRTINFQINSTSPIAFSASEESVSIDDSDECSGVPNIISSRSPEGVIPEESVDDAFNLHSCNVAGDITDKNFEGYSEMANKTNVITSVNMDGQFQPVRAYSFGNKSEINQIKESLASRVRAFSVGSRVKITRPGFKANPRIFNSDTLKNDFAENTSRKSISVPILINKNDKLMNQMADLMEIDFSRTLRKTSSSYNKQPKMGCQIIPVTLRNPESTNSIESLHRGGKNRDSSGYLEMKPITLSSNNFSCDVNIVKKDNLKLCEPNQFNIKDTNLKTTITSPEDNKGFCSTSNEFKLENSECSSSSSDDTKTNLEECQFPNQDLYYASLDLPKCNNEVEIRFKERLIDAKTEEVKNEYAKINFNPPDMSSCSLKKKNN